MKKNVLFVIGIFLCMFFLTSVNASENKVALFIRLIQRDDHPVACQPVERRLRIFDAGIAPSGCQIVEHQTAVHRTAGMDERVGKVNADTCHRMVGRRPAENAAVQLFRIAR